MHVRNIDMLDEVLITCCTSLHTDTASVLCLVFCKGCSLDVSEMRDCDNNILVSVEVLRIELLCRKRNLCSSLVAVLLLHLKSLILDDRELHALVCKNVLAVSDELHEFVVLVLEFLSLESCELTETHLDDCSCLRL